MSAAVAAFVQRKFGPGGACDPKTPGAWKHAARAKAGVAPYSEAFIECLEEVARYILETEGRFPGTFTTIVLPGFVQAVHLDTAFYDSHYRKGAYLATHADHMQHWHGE